MKWNWSIPSRIALRDCKSIPISATPVDRIPRITTTELEMIAET
jgi:hypothetical protein